MSIFRSKDSYTVREERMFISSGIFIRLLSPVLHSLSKCMVVQLFEIQHEDRTGESDLLTIVFVVYYIVPFYFDI